jgi:hypothetical protein
VHWLETTEAGRGGGERRSSREVRSSCSSEEEGGEETKGLGGSNQWGQLYTYKITAHHCQPTHGGGGRSRCCLPALFFSFVTAAIVAPGCRIDHFSKASWKFSLEQENFQLMG